MDKLRKAWQWVWRNKERMVLAVLLIILAYQVYQVAKNPDELFDTTPPPPVASAEEEVPEPPRPPVMSPPGDYSALYVRNPFWVYSNLGESQDSQQASRDLGIALLNIQKSPGGGNSALIRTLGTKWYKEGEKFESYQLRRIDPEKREAVVYSEKLGKEITLKVQ
jgi:hypothetical protein